MAYRKFSSQFSLKCNLCCRRVLLLYKATRSTWSCLRQSPGSPRAFVLKCTGGEVEKELLHRHRRPQLYFHRASTISLRHPSSTCMLVVFGLQAVSGLVADCCDYYLVVTAIRCARDEDGCGSMDGTVVEHAAPPFVSCCGYCSLD